MKEVLACGKPVIVNDVGDLAEYFIPGRNGYIVDPANSREVATAIVNAFANGHTMRKACITSMVPVQNNSVPTARKTPGESTIYQDLAPPEPGWAASQPVRLH